MKNQRSSGFNTFQIASAYIGTVVGAGFASGQEVLQFFSAYGWYGLWGVAVASLLFFFIGYSVLLLGRNLKAKSHVDIVHFTNGRIFGSVIDAIITVFLFGGFAVMIAGAGAIFKEQFHLSAVWGTMFMAFATLLTVFTGTKGVINAISSVVPFLIFSVLFISVFSLLTNPVTQTDIKTASAQNGATPDWLLSAINYASYNIVVAVAVLAPMGAITENKQKLFRGALLGAAGLGICIVAIYFCVLTNIIEISAKEVPMVEIAARISPVAKFIFAVVLFAEVYTTAVGDLYGFAQRVSSRSSREWVITIATVTAFFVSQFGFSNMVKYMYPAVGYGGILFFAGIIFAWFKKRSRFK